MLGLPLYEGVDWNSVPFLQAVLDLRLPLYEGVDWNKEKIEKFLGRENVSLFTREWIEIFG